MASGCPKGKTDYSQGKKAESLQDYDAALAYYQKALKAEPYNANYKIKLNQIRFEAGQSHVKQGLSLRQKGDLQGAAAEFQRAGAIDPSSPVAEQELRKTVEMIAEKNRAADAAAELIAQRRPVHRRDFVQQLRARFPELPWDTGIVREGRQRRHVRHTASDTVAGAVVNTPNQA